VAERLMMTVNNMPSLPDLTADVVVAGAGMAGLCAAVRAQELGARVVLLEKGDAAGGSLALSGGTLWCARSYDDLRRLVPRGDPELGRVLVEEFEAGVEWLRQRGASLSPLPSAPDRVVYWMEPSPRHFVEHMRERFSALGGQLLTRTAATHLIAGADGEVVALGARTDDGARTIHAAAFILATGGFQANPEMRARYYGQWSDRLILRSNPHSSGDGWQMGMGAGAAPSLAMSSFYGHLLPAPPARVPTNDFIAYTMYHSEQSMLVNLRGERFTDESLGDETSAQAVARQPEALAFLIYDDTVYHSYAVRPALAGARAVDKFNESRAQGAPAAVAPSIEALCDALQNLGVYGPGVRESITTYNAAVAVAQADHLRVPRRAKANPIITPPFYALAVTPGITFTLGGLRIDSNAQVLDRGARPIGGLYAAGADAGGIHNEQYAGGLCLGLVFGRRAAEHATDALRANA
jgi:succinate dehydrogenase/fumarate reductase flavoprotein subunit